jgi:hypothetical protein
MGMRVNIVDADVPDVFGAADTRLGELIECRGIFIRVGQDEECLVEAVEPFASSGGPRLRLRSPS